MTEAEKLKKRETELNTELKIINLTRRHAELMQKVKHFTEKAREVTEQIKSLEETLPATPTAIIKKNSSTRTYSSKKKVDTSDD